MNTIESLYALRNEIKACQTCLKDIAKERNQSVYKAYCEGVKVTDLAAIFLVSKTTIYNWMSDPKKIKRYLLLDSPKNRDLISTYDDYFKQWWTDNLGYASERPWGKAYEQEIVFVS